MVTKRAVLEYVKTWKSRGYSDGIPDEVPHRLMTLGKAPSYKAIVKAILRNDITELGLSRPASGWYSELKRIEIEARTGQKQQRLF